MKKHFKGKQYDYRIIIEALGLYYHFSLSYRDCAKIMQKFSIPIHHTTIYRWDKQYGKVCITYGKSAINEENYPNRGESMKRMSKLKGKIVISIVRSIQTVIL